MTTGNTLAIVVLFGCLTASTPGFAQSAETAPATGPAQGMKLIFSDDFDGNTLDLKKWQLGTRPDGRQWGSDSYFATKDDALLCPGVYTVENGMLRIRASYNPNFVDPNHWGRVWCSGMISTAFSDGRSPSAAIRKGYVEIQQKLPAGAGVWPANWAMDLASQTPYPDPRGNEEIDGLEAYGALLPGRFSSTIHNWLKAPQVPDQRVAIHQGLPDLTSNFHTYGYLLDDTNLTVYLDNKPISQTPIFRSKTIDKFFWMFNLAMGGGWPVTVPASGHYDLYIDYVRIYSAD